jgi:16S rRNA (guanine527-N7)-methyltransferase
MYLDLEVKYNQLLMEWNNKVNLVSRKKENIFDLIDDSRLFLDYLPEDKTSNVLDLGTGGGIPGVVLAIHRPKMRFVLVDSIRKKTNALQNIVNELCLKNVKVICIRAEELGKDNEYKKKFDFVIARSVAPLQDLAKWSKDLVKPRGKLIALKGKDIKEELDKTNKQRFVSLTNIEDFGDKQAVIVKFK